MSVYGVGITPMLPMLKPFETICSTKHVAYADDLAGASKLEQLKEWWDRIEIVGPLLGYYPKASKSWLVVKEERLEEARVLFTETKINITTEGRIYLGGFIGNKNSRAEYGKKLVGKWIKKIEKLSLVARSEPQSAYSAFVMFMSLWCSG